MTDQNTIKRLFGSKRWARVDLALLWLVLAGPFSYVAVKWVNALASYEQAIVAEPNVEAVRDTGIESIVLRSKLIRKRGFVPLRNQYGYFASGIPTGTWSCVISFRDGRRYATEIRDCEFRPDFRVVRGASVTTRWILEIWQGDRLVHTLLEPEDAQATPPQK